MKKKLAIASALLVAILVGLYGYFVHSYSRVSPPTAGVIKHQSLTAEGIERHFQYYIPSQHKPAASLLFALHGSMGDGDGMRWQTGYGFEYIAEQDNVIVVYPDGFDNHWNDCRASASYSANTQNINDIAFFKGMIEYFTNTYQIDPQAVFATGASNGGHMTYKLGLTLPDSFTAIAPIIANMPEAANLDCEPQNKPISVAILNGLLDPINPFDGGKVVLFGNDSRGTVLSSNESIQYWLQLASDIPPAPAISLLGNSAKLESWQTDGYQFKLFHLTDTGHVIPSSKVRFGRLMGPNNSGVEAVDEIWSFFKSVKHTPPPI
ncbi:Alpha/Beta hydrolase fold [Maricurvus nonylphenolicus]|uniref:alpha/beta hydrolase family esterase n=1 Tax=Maricurvus nonylphenolicus TaxID=1008307 RepID=UPI0036F2B66F